MDCDKAAQDCVSGPTAYDATTTAAKIAEQERYARFKQVAEVPHIVRDLQRRAQELEQQRQALDHKLTICRELLSVFTS